MTIIRIKADDVSMFPAAVFDEYHTVLDSSADFRSKMCQFGELIERGVQTIYLAATLPPHTTIEFMTIMRIKADDIPMFPAAIQAEEVGLG